MTNLENELAVTLHTPTLDASVIGRANRERKYKEFTAAARQQLADALASIDPSLKILPDADTPMATPTFTVMGTQESLEKILQNPPAIIKYADKPGEVDLPDSNPEKTS